MAEGEFDTLKLNNCLERIKAGEEAARDELYRSVCGRLERLARKMLRQFPKVQRWEDTGDVLQNAWLRLYRALAQLDVTSTRQFYGLATEQIRRELIDLWRHYQGREGIGANYASAVRPAEAPAADPAAPAEPADVLEDWSRFHEGVERLPVEEREVVGLIFYHGWAQADVAELFQIDVRTVQRRWQRAMLKLRDVIRGEGIDGI